DTAHGRAELEHGVVMAAKPGTARPDDAMPTADELVKGIRSGPVERIVVPVHDDGFAGEESLRLGVVLQHVTPDDGRHPAAQQAPARLAAVAAVEGRHAFGGYALPAGRALPQPTGFVAAHVEHPDRAEHLEHLVHEVQVEVTNRWIRWAVLLSGLDRLA